MGKMMNHEIVLVSAVRTPLGSMLGELSSLTAIDLGAIAIRAAIQASGIEAEQVSELIMGCVLPAGLKQAPARQAAMAAGLPQSTACLTVNKVCGSGMKATMLGQDLITLGRAQVVVVGGMESMSNAPYLSPNTRVGARFGHTHMLDHMALDGLEDAYENLPMGIYAEQTVEAYQFSREEQDTFAIRSLERAQAARDSGAFDAEICPALVKSRKGETLVESDEQLKKANIDKIPALRPAFVKNGSVTAANSSSISDGAAAMVLMAKEAAQQQGISPLATIVGQFSHSQAPAHFTTAPVGAIQGLLSSVGWQKEEVDLFEINEAFAVVTMAAIESLGLDDAKVNIHGGACALGHPIGASGARIIVTLVHALKRQNKRKGVAAICIGGGEATAIAIELCE